jgi:competence protein ComEA
MKKFLMGALFLFSTTISIASVNINTATQSELEKINGIGPKKAQAIIEYRNQHKGFKNIDELKEIKGIGDGKTFDKIKKEFVLDGVKTSNTPTSSVQKIQEIKSKLPTKEAKEQIVNPLSDSKKKIIGQP